MGCDGQQEKTVPQVSQPLSMSNILVPARGDGQVHRQVPAHQCSWSSVSSAAMSRGRVLDYSSREAGHQAGRVLPEQQKF